MSGGACGGRRGATLLTALALGCVNAGGGVTAVPSRGGVGGTVRVGGDREIARGAPAARLERAIAAAGGVTALDRARAFAWDGTATVTSGGRVVRIAGRWLVQPPDTAVVETYDVTRGPATTRALVVAVPRGWVAANGALTPMPAAFLASERDEFAFYDAMRLLPLRSARLTEEAPDSAGHPGLRATRPGRPAVSLWFGPDGRLAHLAAEVADPAGGEGRLRQDVWLEGMAEAGGVRWPRRIRIYQRGAEFFDLTIGGLRVLPRVDDERLRGPAGGALESAAGGAITGRASGGA